MRQLDDDLWVEDRPQRFWGLEVGKRMTVMCLSGGRLLLHSPVPIDEGLRRELDAIGEVRYAVAPNRFHHLDIARVTDSYPDARLWIGPGVTDKRPELAHLPVLGDEPPPEWRDEVDQCFFAGRPMENEVAFFHRSSRTLVLCDLAFNFGRDVPLPTRLLMSVLQRRGGFGPSRLDPFLIEDRRAARASLDRILSWDFDRVIVSHGDILEHGGHERLRRGYAWL